MFKIIAYRTLLEKVDIMIRDLFTQDEETRKAAEAEKAKIRERIELYKKTAEEKKKMKRNKNSKIPENELQVEPNQNTAQDTKEDNDYVHVSKDEADTPKDINTPSTTSSDHAVDEINRVKQLVCKWETLVLDKKMAQKNFKVSIVNDAEEERKIVRTLEQREKSSNEREFEKYMKDQREKEIKKALEKIQKKENVLSRTFQGMTGDYRAHSDNLKDI
jgi:hypothetical protein